MNIDIALAPIEKLAAVAKSTAFGLFALAPSIFVVSVIDLVDVLASDKTGPQLFVAVAGQWLFAIALPGVMIGIGLQLSRAARAVYARPT